MGSCLTEDIIPSPPREDEMQREMDLIRALLLRIESGQEFDGTSQIQPDFPGDLGITDYSYAEVAYHLNLLIRGGFIDGIRKMQMPIISQLTWAGHDFLDSVRDPETWAKTKSAAVRAGGFTVELLRDLAVGLIKKQIEEKTGIKL